MNITFKIWVLRSFISKFEIKYGVSYYIVTDKNTIYECENKGLLIKRNIYNNYFHLYFLYNNNYVYFNSHIPGPGTKNYVVIHLL